ncbi:hypothetical protein BC827DRAFT_731124 [Russula dissimulans]|nr:hypothetical protein BC827DRAFT_731124 [Russula dissimulans]
MPKSPGLVSTDLCAMTSVLRDATSPPVPWTFYCQKLRGGRSHVGSNDIGGVHLSVGRRNQRSPYHVVCGSPTPLSPQTGCTTATTTSGPAKRTSIHQRDDPQIYATTIRNTVPHLVPTLFLVSLVILKLIGWLRKAGVDETSTTLLPLTWTLTFTIAQYLDVKGHFKGL